MHRETPHTRGLELLFDAAASLPAPLLSAAIQLQLFILKNQNPHSAGSASPPLLGPSECIVEHERQRLPQRRARRRRRQVNARPFVLSALNCFFIYGFWFFVESCSRASSTLRRDGDHGKATPPPCVAQALCLCLQNHLPQHPKQPKTEKVVTHSTARAAVKKMKRGARATRRRASLLHARSMRKYVAMCITPDK